MEPQTTSPVTNQAPQAQLQANVDYLPGITIAGATSALLEWSADNRIKFFKMDADKNAATEVLFDVPLSEIQKVTGSMIMLTFKVGGKKYNAQFSRTMAPKLAVGGAIGMGLAYADTKTSGINQWIEKLKANNVPMKVMGWGWAVKWGLIISGVLLAGIVIYAVITTT